MTLISQGDSKTKCLLKGCVIATHDDSPSDLHSRIESDVRSLGGVYVPQITKDTTHLIVLQPTNSRPERKSLEKKTEGLKCHIVQALWLEHCQEVGFRVSESLYNPRRSAGPLSGLQIYIDGNIHHDGKLIVSHDWVVNALDGSLVNTATAQTIMCVAEAEDNADNVALARDLEIPVVYHTWLLECLRTGELEPSDDYQADLEERRRRVRTRATVPNPPLLGCKVFLRHSVSPKIRSRIKKGFRKLGGKVQPEADEETTYIVTTRKDYEDHSYKFVNREPALVVEYDWLESCIIKKSNLPIDRWRLKPVKQRSPCGVTIICELPAGHTLASLTSAIEKLGGTYCSEVTEDTKYLCATSKQVANLHRSIVWAGQSGTIAVIGIEWLLDSISEGEFVDWMDYFHDAMEEEYRPPLYDCSIVVAASWPHSDHATIRDDILKLGGTYQMCVDNHTSHICMSWEDFEGCGLLMDTALDMGKKIVDHKWLHEVIQKGTRITESRYVFNRHAQFSDGEYDD